MSNITTIQSSPLHLENTISHLAIEALKPSQFPHTVREMMYDPTVAGSLSFLRSVINRNFSIVPHKDATASEKRLTEALNDSLSDLPYTMKQMVNNFLDLLTHGYSLNEVTLKRVDGKLVFNSISPISSTTISKFVFEQGRLKKVILDPAPNDGLIEQAHSGEQIEIEGEKLLLIRNDPSQDFPLGHSLLHGAWSSYKAKKIAQEYSIIGIAKRLSGVLKISVPSEYITKYLSDPNSDEAIYLEQLLHSADMLHSGRSSHLMIPSDIFDGGIRQFEVSTIGGDNASGASEVTETIDQLDKAIQISLQTVVLALGGSSESSGSFALSDSKNQMLTQYVEHIQATIADAFRDTLKLAFEANGMSTARLPHVEFEEVEELDWETFTKSFATLANAQLITPDVGLEKHLREKLDCPPVRYSERIDVVQ